MRAGFGWHLAKSWRIIRAPVTAVRGALQHFDRSRQRGGWPAKGYPMTDHLGAKLREAISDVLSKIGRFQDRALGEQNTKASLIEPILDALGWDIRDPDEVHREFKPTAQDKPVDYCLTLLRKPRLLVEAKGLGETPADRKWIGQILGYAAVAGVEWCVLTDGNEYRFYNASVPLDADEKLFFQIKLTDCPPDEAARTLKLVSRSDLQENLLEVLWATHYVDRRVKHALQEMVTNRDRGLIRLIRRKASKLTPREISESLRRLDIRIEFPALMRQPTKPPKAGTSKGNKEGRKRQKGKKTYAANMLDVISAGLLVPPIKLFREYRGKLMEATLLPDGAVEFEGTRFSSCSTAAETARSTMTGRKMNTNGWSFWQYLDEQGKKLTLFEARERFLKMKGGAT
jgi:predicted type IV restriction endonuclease